MRGKWIQLFWNCSTVRWTRGVDAEMTDVFRGSRGRKVGLRLGSALAEIYKESQGPGIGDNGDGGEENAARAVEPGATDERTARKCRLV